MSPPTLSSGARAGAGAGAGSATGGGRGATQWARRWNVPKQVLRAMEEFKSAWKKDEADDDDEELF